VVVVVVGGGGLSTHSTLVCHSLRPLLPFAVPRTVVSLVFLAERILRDAFTARRTLRIDPQATGLNELNSRKGKETTKRNMRVS